MTYVPLQVISSYSLLQSPIRISELVTEAKKRGYKALAMTDINVMYGAVEFYDTCIDAGIQPIIGLTLNLPGVMLSENNYSILLLAKNQTGYQNLLKISTLKSSGESDVTIDQLNGRLDGLYVILPPLAEINDLLLQGKSADISDLISKLMDLGLTKQDLKFGVDYHSSDALIDMLSKVAADNQVQLIADAPVQYLNAEDYFPMQVLKAIAAGTKISNVAELSQQVGPYFLRPQDQMEKEYQRLHLNAALQAIDEVVSN
ncbi:MAG: PHP domain-containing protein, partial [Lentilactobacillus hilgardii]